MTLSAVAIDWTSDVPREKGELICFSPPPLTVLKYNIHSNIGQSIPIDYY